MDFSEDYMFELPMEEQETKMFRGREDDCAGDDEEGTIRYYTQPARRNNAAQRYFTANPYPAPDLLLKRKRPSGDFGSAGRLCDDEINLFLLI